jgi:signal transduction histidine kinase
LADDVSFVSVDIMAASYQKRLTPIAVALASSPVVRALRSAAGRAAERLANGNGNGSGNGISAQGADDLGNELALLSETIYSMAADGKSALTPANVVFPRHHLDALRTEFLARLKRAKRVDPKELLAVLSAMEEIANVSAPTVAGEFAQKLASSDGLKAVIEVAHDMRSPLSAILFLVETIRGGQSGPVTPVQERQLGLVYGAAFGLSGLASDILEAARSNLLDDAQARPFSLSDIIADVCAIVAPMAEEKRLTLQQTYSAVDGRVGHVAAAHRVLLNLTSNAIKYTETGSVAVGCKDVDETHVEFWIQDTGRGIPDKVLAMLFAGFRPGSVGVRFSSAGLGLAICRTLLEKMGSSLKVQTSPGAGTRFSFVLKLPPV